MSLDKNQQVQRLVVLGFMATLDEEDQLAVREMKQKMIAVAESAKTPVHAAIALALAGFDYADKHGGQ